MRTTSSIAAAAVFASALAMPGFPLTTAVKATMPVAKNFGYNKAVAFTVDEGRDLLTGQVEYDDGSASSTPSFIQIPVEPDVDAKGAGQGGVAPPFFGGEGDCCKPTEQCHAYVNWALNQQNNNGWKDDAQREDAMGHIDCCLRQYRASCKNPMPGNTVIWRDPTKFCSPGKDDVPK